MQHVLEQIDDPGGSATPGKERCTFELCDASGLLSHHQREWLTRNAHAAIHLATDSPGEVRVRVVNDAEMSAAHLKYSGIEGTTDVLTFDLAEGGAARGEPLDVDILICADEAARQATSRGYPPERELLLYVLHGVLHCLGYDDHDDGTFAIMHAEEDRILKQIGVGETFAAPEARPGASGERA